MLVVYAISILLLLVLFVLITPIELTLDAEARRREGENLLKGSFAVKWLFLSRKISIERPEKKESEDRPEKGKKREVKDETEIEMRKEMEREKEKELENRKMKELELKKEIEREKEKELENRKMKELEIKKEIEREKEKELEKRKMKEIETGKKEKFEKEIEETKEPKKFWKKEYSYILRAFRDLRKPLFRLFSDTLNALKIKHLDADFTFGLPDPADTGMLCGFAHSLLGALHGRCRQCSVYINPVFMDSVLDFRGNTKISIKIYSLIFSFIKFILNRKTLSFTYSIIKEWLQGKLKAHSQAL